MSLFRFVFFFWLRGNTKKKKKKDYLTLEVRSVPDILLTYMPTLSILTKYKILGLGGLSKTAKTSAMVPTHLASASAHRLPSLYTRTTWTWRNLVNKHLQSYKRGANGLLVTALDLTRSTTTFASNSTINLWIHVFKASFNPSLNAHNSAVMLVANPIDLTNPLSQLPLQSLINLWSRWNEVYN